MRAARACVVAAAAAAPAGAHGSGRARSRARARAAVGSAGGVGGSGRAAPGRMKWTSQTAEHISSPLDAGVVNFALGQPAPALLAGALDLVRRAHAAALAPDEHEEGCGNDGDGHGYAYDHEAALMLQYTRRAGSERFRSAVADFLNARHASDAAARASVASASAATVRAVSPNEVFATSGVSHGLSLCCARLDHAGRRVALLADPTYFLARPIVEQAGLEPRALVWKDDTGADDAQGDAAGLGIVAAFEAACDAVSQESGAPPALLYLVPTFANPTALTLGARTRAALVAAAASRGVRVVADEVYQLLSFPGAENAPPPPMRHFDPDGATVISVGSFAKYMAPAMRVGWVEGCADTVLAPLGDDGVISSGGCGNPLGTAAVAHALRSGDAAAHLDHMRTALAERCAALVEALRVHEGELWELHARPRGGYFLWLGLKGGVRSEVLLPQAVSRGVAFCCGSRCAADARAPTAEALAHHVRLSFAMHTPEELRAGVRRLAEAVRAYDGSGAPSAGETPG